MQHTLLQPQNAFTQVVALRAGWHPEAMEIRDAVAEDAEAACRVLRRSIVELCHADHQNYPAILKQWLENKTPEGFMSWIKQPDNSLLVAVEDDRILAVGSVTDAGKITLNYVSPDARFRGVSRALLGALEARAAARQHTMHAHQHRNSPPLLSGLQLC